MTFTHIHSSSLYERSAASLKAAATEYNSVADLVTYTETQAEYRESAIRAANGKEFGFVSGDITYSNDCSIAFRKSKFKLIYKENYKSTNLAYINKRGRKRDPQYATTAVLEDVSNNKRIVVTVIHLAAGVESDLWLKRTTARTRSWYSAFRGAKARANTLKKKFNASAVLFIADFNLDFKKRWARALVKSLAPLYTLTWTKTNVTGGTHGRHLIDATLIRGSLKVKGSAVLFADDNSSDHRPYKEVLTWK